MPGVLNEFAMVDRVKRSAIVLGAAVLLAATLIPIPIIHLLGIPLFLIGGVVVSIRQLSLMGRLRPVRIACPKCGELNRVGGGLGLSSLAPRERMCDSCRRELTRRIEIAPDVRP
ncbi:MAG: hypothetical protein ACRELE_11935 [Gemmatimonadales bacterium]